MLHARDKLIAAELISFDPLTAEIYVDRWLKHNPPMNEKHARGTQRLIENIESDTIREKVEAEFMAADKSRSSKVVSLHSPALANSRLVRNGRAGCRYPIHTVSRRYRYIETETET